MPFLPLKTLIHKALRGIRLPSNCRTRVGVIRYSLMISVILVYLMTIVSTYINILLVTFIVFIGFDLIRPAITSYLSKIAGNEQGFVGGMNSMFTSVGNVLGPIIGGILFDVNLDYPFYFASIVLAIGVLFTLRWKKPVQLRP